MKFVLTFILTAVLALGNNASAAELTKATKKKQATEWQQICQPDKKVPAAWKSYQKFLLTTEPGCDNNFYRYVNYPVVDYKGTAAITSKDQLQNIEMCKIKNRSDQFQVAFPIERHSPLFPNYNIQVVPIETNDFRTSSNPTKDYGHFFNLLNSWFENNADFGNSTKIRIPETYIYLNRFLGEYKNINSHGNPTDEGRKFYEDVVKAADISIDFTEVNLIIVVVPPQVDPSLLGINPWGAPLTTNETDNGRNWLEVFSITPFNFSELDRPNVNTSFLAPEILLHEFQHATASFGDYEASTGSWGMMSLPSTTDLLGWQKYTSGFYRDEQVVCLPTDKTSVRVITPSVAKTTKEKLAVIPISKTKVIVLESMRSGGFNYKLPKGSEGLLVYEIDTDLSGYRSGISVISTKRGMSTERLMGATLKKKESVVTNGFKITVTESGTFGDVVKVEKAS